MNNSEIFDAAAVLPRHQREAYLNEVCGDDQDRRAEIDALYAGIEQAEDASEKLRLIDRLRDLLKEHHPSQDEIDRSLFFIK